MQFSDENNIVNQFCCDRNPFHLTAWHFSTNFLGKIKKKIPSVSSCKLCQNLLHNGNDCMQLLGYSGNTNDPSAYFHERALRANVRGFNLYFRLFGIRCAPSVFLLGLPGKFAEF